MLHSPEIETALGIESDQEKIGNLPNSEVKIKHNRENI